MDYEVDFDKKTPQTWQELPIEVLRSSAVESLLSQNEDLTARLKISLQRLAQTENEKEQEKLAVQNLQKQLQATQDHILIVREKQNLEKLRDEALEKQMMNLKRQLEITQMEYAEMRASAQKVRGALTRLSSYRKRVRNWILPAFKKMKQEFREANHSLSQKDQLIQSLREQSLEISKTASRQVSEVQAHRAELIEYHESERKNWMSQLELLKSINADLETRLQHLETQCETHDEIQNRNIALERSREEMRTRYELEIDALTAIHKEIEAELKTAQNSKQALLDETKDLMESKVQLEKTRILWKEKCEELDKLQLAYSALEKMNLELSKKLTF